MPKGIDDDALLIASRFREGGRFPVLSYRHESGVSNATFVKKYKYLFLIFVQTTKIFSTK